MSCDGNESVKAPSVSVKKRIIFLGIYFILLAILLYIGWLVYRTTQFYDYMKEEPQTWKGRVYKYDPDLGLALIPGGKGAEAFKIGPEIPMLADSNGFRIPANEPESTRPLKRPLILALGCSFTYGQGVLAEETYPYLVARELNGRAVNAAVCAYGLSQMLMVAERLIPKYKPDYVLVQYSAWLERRSVNYFAPIVFGKLPTPFFANTPDGKVTIHPPVFKSKYYDLSVSDYYSKRESVGDYLSFATTIGFPLFIYDDYNMIVFYLKKLGGAIPEPARNQQEKIEKQIYGEIEEICVNNGAKMLVVTWGNGGVAREPLYLFSNAIELSLKNAVIVDAYSALFNRLDDKSEQTYLSVYGNYRGSPPVLVDTHPNAYAHAVVAYEIVKAIKSLR